MNYLRYELTDKEWDLIYSLEEEEAVGNIGWDWENKRSNAASYAINVLGYDFINNWTEDKLDACLEHVIKKTAFGIIKKIPFNTKRLLFLESKGLHHTSRPTENQDWNDVYGELYGISDYLLAHKLSINEAKKLFQLSCDIENGTIKLKDDLSVGSESSFINYIG